MKEPKNGSRILKAIRFFGGGGGGGNVNIAPRKPSQEKKTIGNWYDFQNQQYNDYVSQDPLLSTAKTGALAGYGAVPGLTAPLAAQAAETPGFFGGLQNQIGGYQGQLGGYQGQLGDYQKQLTGDQGLLSGLYRQLGTIRSGVPGVSNLTGPLQTGFNDYAGTLANQINPVLQSGGALTPQLLRNSQQQSLGLQSMQGTAHTNAGLAQTLLNSDAARQQRYGTYLGYAQGATGAESGLAGQIQNLNASNIGLRSGLLGQQAGLLGQQAGLTGQGAGLTQAGAGITGQQAGLTGLGAGLFGQQGALQSALSQVQQGLQSNSINQLLNVGNAGVSQFSGLMNPILNYLGQAFGGNLESRIAAAQAGVQKGIAGDNKKAGGISGGISAIGTIASAAL